MTQESEGIHLITRADTKIPLKARGWDAMKKIKKKALKL
jgi:thiamine-monophosphate kinase